MKFASTCNIAVIAGMFALGLAVSGNTASACDYYWKTITVYETVTQPVEYYVTAYDHCDRPYQVKKITYKQVRVPVVKRIKVSY